MRAVSPRIPFEYFFLHRVRPTGPVVAMVGNTGIFAAVVDEDGHWYDFVGLAQRDDHGRINVLELQPSEWLVKPGLIYKERSCHDAGCKARGSSHAF